MFFGSQRALAALRLAVGLGDGALAIALGAGFLGVGWVLAFAANWFSSSATRSC
jgi:hypothetical protein